MHSERRYSQAPTSNTNRARCEGIRSAGDTLQRPSRSKRENHHCPGQRFSMQITFRSPYASATAMILAPLLRVALTALSRNSAEPKVTSMKASYKLMSSRSSRSIARSCNARSTMPSRPSIGSMNAAYFDIEVEKGAFRADVKDPMASTTDAAVAFAADFRQTIGSAAWIEGVVRGTWRLLGPAGASDTVPGVRPALGPCVRAGSAVSLDPSGPAIVDVAERGRRV